MQSSLKKVFASKYPLLVSISVPLLMAAGTYFNLRTFSRDMNSLLRSQAVSLGESIMPLIREDFENKDKVREELVLLKNSNEEIYSASILVKNGEDFETFVTTEETNLDIDQSGLNQLAVGFDRAVAGLVYDPSLRKNVWNVVIPTDNNTLLVLRMSTESVEALLARTSRDSIIILIVIIIATLIIFVNHLIFYNRALETSKLKELDKLKDEFISMAAHELKAPVTGLVGYLDLMKVDIEKGNLKEIKDNILVLDSLTASLGSLIEDLLNVSRIEQSRLAIEIKQTDVVKLLEEVVASYKIHAEKKGILLSLVTEPISPINTDPDRLKQVISNLVSNAVKYTPKGSVNVKTIVNSGKLEIQVKDTGVGISPEHMDKMFGKFFRVKDEKTQDQPGTGLGLWISRQIIRLLGGDLYFESIYGTGSVFTISLPISFVNDESKNNNNKKNN